MSARVLVIGLDAAEATLIEQWSAAGAMPTMARLNGEGAVYRLGNPLKTLPGAIWPELVSGRSCGQVPLYYHPRQLHTGEAVSRPVEAAEVDFEDYYWVQASRAGRRVAAVDMPQTVGSPGLNGIQIFEWGLHDRNFAVTSMPAELIDDVRARYGDHPVQACDRHKRRHDGYRALLDNLLTGVERKTALLLDLIARERWDLFSCCYGETHCVGHQFWHFRDRDHPWHEADAPAEFRDAIRSVYRRVDEGIGALIAAAGPDAAVLVVASHGMGPYTGGPQLLPEVLVRLGLGSEGGSESLASLGLRRIQQRVHRAPRAVQPLLKRLARTGAVMRVQSSAGCLLDPLESERTKACALKNNRCGAIRLNLKGREPHGGVAPGAEAEALIAEIRRELMALEDPRTGQPIVADTVTAAEAFGPDHHPDVPDIMVVFRTDLGILERCRSPRVGEVYSQLYHGNIPRSGDHTTESRLWAAGPAIRPADGPLDANVLDLAPTVLRLLDVPVPQRTDGRPLAGCEAWVAGRAAMA